MKKLALLSLLLFGSATSSHALLPPLYESIKEYKALLNDPRFVDNLTSGETILDIRREHNNFEVITNQHKLNVKIVYEPQGRPGPAQFHLEFMEPISLK